ncbi:DUF3592 domain-containing protein [Nocardia sp. NRRL WC-3656]|uniref:DUF3592 domain-containing protein n=1 Tax=Nocardia sp. NRRL WC-3656 TaxID=1463824 RepID=UPI0004C38BA4|nr:DUF3592 domain-containing protein [Nocardia sp. NRRL WC-3656]
MGYWFVAMVFLWGGMGGLPLSAQAARFGLRFARDGVVVAGRIVDVERSHRAVLDRNGTETIVEYSSPVVAFRTADCREMREAAIIARARTMAGRYEDRFVAVSQRGQWQGRTRTPGEAVQVRHLPDTPERFRIDGKPGTPLLWFLPLSLALLSTRSTTTPNCWRHCAATSPPASTGAAPGRR